MVKTAQNVQTTVCQFQIGHCFDCKDGFRGDMCEKGMHIYLILMFA